MGLQPKYNNNIFIKESTHPFHWLEYCSIVLFIGFFIEIVIVTTLNWMLSGLELTSSLLIYGYSLLSFPIWLLMAYVYYSQIINNSCYVMYDGNNLSIYKDERILCTINMVNCRSYIGKWSDANFPGCDEMRKIVNKKLLLIVFSVSDCSHRSRQIDKYQHICIAVGHRHVTFNQWKHLLRHTSTGITTTNISHDYSIGKFEYSYWLFLLVAISIGTAVWVTKLLVEFLVFLGCPNDIAIGILIPLVCELLFISVVILSHYPFFIFAIKGVRRNRTERMFFLIRIVSIICCALYVSLSCVGQGDWSFRSFYCSAIVTLTLGSICVVSEFLYQCACSQD
jgi:hypothetical protein